MPSVTIGLHWLALGGVCLVYLGFVRGYFVGHKAGEQYASRAQEDLS